MACMKGHVQVAELLLEHGADINYTDTYKVRVYLLVIYCHYYCVAYSTSYCL